MRCILCHSEKHVVRNGSVRKKRRYRCTSCKRNFVVRQGRKYNGKCECGLPLVDGKCLWCKEPLIQYHIVDRSVNLYV